MREAGCVRSVISSEYKSHVNHNGINIIYEYTHEDDDNREGDVMMFLRRKYLVSSEFQLKFILTFLIISLLGSVAAAVVFNVVAMSELEAHIWSVHISAQSTGDILKQLFIKVNVISLLCISALLAVIAFLVIRKTAGALHRMSYDIRRIAGGDLSAGVSLRAKDDFRDVADTLNSMTQNLRAEFLSMTETYNDISRQLRSLEKSSGEGQVSPGDYDAVMENIANLESRVNKFQLMQQ